MQGRRVDAIEGAVLPKLEPGDYGKDSCGSWWVCPPRGGYALIDPRKGWTATENADGTLTVSPSIFMTAPEEHKWHGYLEKGVWREC